MAADASSPLKNVTISFLNAPNGTVLPTSGGLGFFRVNYAGTTVFLSNFTPVTQPSTWCLLGSGALLTLSTGVRRRLAWR